MATKRHKPSIPLLSIEEVDDALRQVGILEADISSLQADEEKQLSLIREEFRILTYPKTVELDSLKERILYYLQFRRADFEEKRSQELVHGTIGWRKTRSDALRVIQKKALASLKALGLGNFIRLKEEVNKDALADHLVGHPDLLDKIDGVSRVEEVESPWFEVRREPETVTA